MKKGTTSSAAWLAAAVQRQFISADQASTLAQKAESDGMEPSQLAIEQGLVTAVQNDIIEAVTQPDSIAPGYEILDVIGHGGLGVVYKARQINLDRAVALKTVLVSGLRQPGALARFQQEAKTIGALRHPNIVTAFDSSTHAGRLFLAMELVEGSDLLEFISQHGRMDEHTGLWIARQVASGLAHAAEQNIVHRDIKPGNILLTENPKGYALPDGVPLAKITDFGLALLAADVEDTRLTMAGTTMGTPQYMAPEQFTGSTVDARADVFALGATLYHMFAGSEPYGGSSFAEIVANRFKGTRPGLETAAEHVSPLTVQLVETMMAEDPQDRPGDYAMLLGMIDEVIVAQQAESAAPQSTTLAPTLSRLSVPTHAAGVDLQSAGRPTAVASQPKKRLVLILLGLVVAAGLLVAAANAWRSPTLEKAPAMLKSSGKELPLFDGSTLAGWDPRFRGAWGQSRDQEGGYVLQGRATSGQAARLNRRLPTDADSARQTFRVRLGVDVQEAQSMEIHFGSLSSEQDEKAAGDGLPHALRFADGQVTLLSADDRSQFQSQGRPLALMAQPDSESPLYQDVKIDFHDGHWHAFLNNQFVGSLAGRGGKSDFAISLVVDEGVVNFEGLRLVELLEPPDTN